MTFPGLDRYYTGVLVPVAALRSGDSLGAGEFGDLPALAAWCSRVGLDLIQILPVNDSGWQPSPYSALSAFALHPLYLRIEALAEYARLAPADRSRIDGVIANIRAEHDQAPRMRYGALLDAKTAAARAVYDCAAEDAGLRSATRDFAAQNEWVTPYAAYKVIKAENGGASWKEWSDYRDPTGEILAELWSDPRRLADLTFHVWIQMRLDEQLRAAAEAVAAHGVLLKGDLPILINEDSVDTWAHRNYFSTRLRAGAPPDGQNPMGQNWGLPVYDWGELAQDDYRWWKDRLRQASRYYAAYRIDHVLGFFRVWSVPADDQTGFLGHFSPGAVADRERLHAAGLDNGRISWLSEPHLAGETLRRELGEEAQSVISSCLRQVGDEDLYVFAPHVRGERDIMRLECRAPARDWLAGQYRDRALVRLEHDTFVPAWCFRDCSRYTTLTDDERRRFDSLVAELTRDSQVLWEEHGRRLLGFMAGTTDLLACAEDLGAIPDCVPQILEELGILGLRIPRWARRWNESGQPYIPPSNYPLLSVCAPSVHDTTTMRGWWREEEEKYGFWRSLGLSGEVPRHYDAHTARTVTEALLTTNSAVCVFQIQDLLALVEDLVPDDPEDERVNVPGTTDETNWSYRMGVRLEDLAARDDLAAILAPLLSERRKRRPGLG